MHPVQILEYGGKIFAQSEQLKKAVDRVGDAPPGWHSTLLIELATECLSNSMELFRGIEEMSVSRCAWGARNLLELSYFTRYVAQSPENARRFHEDAMCDLKDMLKKLETVKPLDPGLARGKTQLDSYMKIMEQVTGEDNYLKKCPSLPTTSAKKSSTIWPTSTRPNSCILPRCPSRQRRTRTS